MRSATKFGLVVSTALIVSAVWAVVVANAFMFGMHIGAEDCRGD